MRTSAAATIAGAVLLVAAPAPARADTRDVVDFHHDVCTLVATNDTSVADMRTGIMAAGPLTNVDGRLRCDVQVGERLHSGLDETFVDGSGTDVVVVRPNVVTYPVPAAGVPVYVCAEFTPWAQDTLYWDPAGFWSPSPDTPCDEVTTATTSDPAFDSANYGAVSPDATMRTADATVCALLLKPANAYVGADPTASLYVDSEGDVYVGGTRVWNCPPY